MTRSMVCDWCGVVLAWGLEHPTRKPFEWLALNDGRHMCDACRPAPKIEPLVRGSEMRQCSTCERHYRTAAEFEEHVCKS